MKHLIFLILFVSASLNGMWFDQDWDEYAPHALPPLPPTLPPNYQGPTKQEKKARKEKENQELMQIAQRMVTQKENLDNLVEIPGHGCFYTLLTVAAQHKCHQNVLQFALDNGALIDAQDAWDNSPLKQAVQAKCTPNVIYLLNRGARIKNKKLLQVICNPSYDDVAANSTQRRVATLTALLDFGANPNENDASPSILSNLLTGLMGKRDAPAHPEHFNYFIDQRMQMIRKLLETGLDPFKEDATGKSDWNKIIEKKDRYNPDLFEFAQQEFKTKKLR